MAMLIPNSMNLDTTALFQAANKIRLLIATSQNHYVANTIKARTLFIRPTASNAITDEAQVNSHFTDITIQHLEGNHFSIMKNPIVSELATIINHQLVKELI